MADSNKINYKDLFDEGNILSGLQSLITKMISEIKMQAGTAGASLSGNKGTTANDLKKQAKDIEDIEKAEKSLAQAEKELAKIEKEKLALQKQLQDANDENIKAKIRYAKASKEQREQLSLEMKIAESAEGSYNKLTAQYSLNMKTLNAMTEAQRKNTAEGQKLEKETKAIREQMNSLQKSTGNYTLQVGKYGIATENVVMSLGEMKTELRALRNISFAGKSKEEVDALKLKIGELTDQMGDMQAELEVLGTEKSAVLVGGLKLISAGVEGVVGSLSVLGVESETIKKLETKMTSLIAVTHALAEIEDTISSGKARAILLRIKDMALTTAQTVKNWALTASQKAYNLVVGNSTGALKGFKLALAGTGIGLIIVGITALIQNWDKLTTAIGFSEDSLKSYNKVSQETLLVSDAQKERISKLKDELKELTKEYDIASGKTTETAQKRLDTEIKLGDNLYEAVAEKNKKITTLTEAFKSKYDALFGSIIKGTGTRGEAIYYTEAELASKRYKLQIKYIQDVSIVNKQFNIERDLANKTYNKELDLINVKEKKTIEEKIVLKKEETKALEKEGKIVISNTNKVVELLNSSKEKEEITKREVVETEIKDNSELLNIIEETTTAIIESYKKRSEAKEENLNKELEASKDYETQLRELAKKGIEGAKENLAFEQKAQAEIEKKKLAEQKKQKRLELGMSAISAFGKIAETEPDKALTKTITEITKLLAFINSLPAFAEGVIEFSGKGTTKSDSNLVRLSNKESVIKAEATEMYKPHLKAMNELRYNPLDYVNINKDRSVNNNATFGLISELKELKEITKSKQEYKIDVDGITHEIVERIKSANTVNINRYKRKGLF